MDPIEGKLYSPFEKEFRKPIIKRVKSDVGLKYRVDLQYEIERRWQRTDATVSKIRESSGFPVHSFRELINEVALVTYSNKNYEMFYRGQVADYKDSQGVYYKTQTPKTVIYPSICRPDKKPDGTYKQSIRSHEIIKRYDILYELIGMERYLSEYSLITLLQHYDICPTPLIDITQSLRVAATFALMNSATGFLYVFGLPYPNQSISHYIDAGIVLIKLQNSCPIKALRPRYQEGYLVGKYPIRPTKEGGDNLARRLVAKFHLQNEDGNFWDKHFKPMPEDVLYPKNDPIEKDLIRFKTFIQNSK